MADITNVLKILPDVSEMLYQMYKDETDKESISVRYDQYLAIDDAIELLKSQKAEIERLTLSGEWKRMSDLPIETDDRFECSICGNVVHYHDRINLYTFNDYCGRCGAYNGFKLRTVSRNEV